MSEQVNADSLLRDRAMDFCLSADKGIVHGVGDESIAVITRLSSLEEDDDHYVGNVLRRTCEAAGKAACQTGCALRGSADYLENFDKQCADRNLVEAFSDFGLDPNTVLMVAVTGNDVGFGDEELKYEEEGRLTYNPEGFGELPGFNAFFARASEVPAIGSRLADCAHIEFEFKDSEGETVIGFEHGTRPNMYGSGSYAFDLNGQKVSYTHYVMAKALAHYGADPSSMKLRVSSSIKPENFVKRFDTEENLESHIPGWFEDGFAANTTNPAWQPGMPTQDEEGNKDVWHADARGLILRDITEAMQALGVPEENVTSEPMLDPADTHGEFSSYEKKFYGDTRDLYLVAHHTAINLKNDTICGL